MAKGNIIAGAAVVAVLAIGGIAYATMNHGDNGQAKPDQAAGGPPSGGGAGKSGGQGGPGGPGGPGGRGAPPTQVEAIAAAAKTFSSRIEALGTLEPRERVVLTANAADRVTGVFFEDGQRVTSGKILMTLVNDEETAQLESSKATEANAKLVYERNQRLASGEAIAALELDRSKSAYDAAVANTAAIQARLRDRVLKAPFSGVLGFRQVSVGAFVSPGQPVATLIDDSQMRLEFGVPSIFLSDLHQGTEIKAITRDLPGRVFTGKLTSIDNLIDPVTLAVKVRATLPNQDGALKAGMSMNVEVDTKPRTALSIPEIAILAEGTKSFVYVVDNTSKPAKAVKTEIVVGLRERGEVEVLSGLKAGVQVVTDGALKLRPNAPVRLKGDTGSPGGPGGAPKIASGEAGPDKSRLAQ